MTLKGILYRFNLHHLACRLTRGVVFLNLLISVPIEVRFGLFPRRVVLFLAIVNEGVMLLDHLSCRCVGVLGLLGLVFLGRLGRFLLR